MTPQHDCLSLRLSDLSCVSFDACYPCADCVPPRLVRTGGGRLALILGTAPAVVVPPDVPRVAVDASAWRSFVGGRALRVYGVLIRANGFFRSLFGLIGLGRGSPVAMLCSPPTALLSRSLPSTEGSSSRRRCSLLWAGCACGVDRLWWIPPTAVFNSSLSRTPSLIPSARSDPLRRRWSRSKRTYGRCTIIRLALAPRDQLGGWWAEWMLRLVTH